MHQISSLHRISELYKSVTLIFDIFRTLMTQSYLAHLLLQLVHQQLLRRLLHLALVCFFAATTRDLGVALQGGGGAIKHKHRTDTVKHQPEAQTETGTREGAKRGVVVAVQGVVHLKVRTQGAQNGT